MASERAEKINRNPFVFICSVYGKDLDRVFGDKHSGLQTASLMREESEPMQLGTPLKRGKRKDYNEWCITSPLCLDIKPSELGK